MRDLTALPKVDLHVHLEGSIRPRTTAELADRHGVPPPTGLRDGRYAFRDFPDFIAQFVMGLACLRDPDDFRRVALEFCEDEARQGVRLAELFFSVPDHRVGRDDWDAPLEAVLDGLAEGRERFAIDCAVIVDVVRGIPIEFSERGLRVALRHRNDGVIGIGLGGSEDFSPEDYRHIFDQARRAGLHSVAHAGESGGPDSIRSALDALRAERIGHGIRCLEDPELVAELRDQQVPLEVCPTSNVMTGVVSSIAEHPLPRLLEAGLNVTLNSDDPGMFSSPVAGEYEVARTVFGLDDEALAGLARAGVRASFADDRTKAEVEHEIDAWLAQGSAPV